MDPANSLPTSAEKKVDTWNGGASVKEEPPKAERVPERPVAAQPAVAPPNNEPDQKNSWQENPQTKKVLDELRGAHTTLSVRMNQDTGQIVVEIRDEETGETVRKLPLHEKPEDLRGFFVDETE